MEKRMNTGRRRSGGWAKRRRGFILVMALIVILVGAALTVGMLVLTEGFSRGSIFQRMAYEQHIDVANEVKRIEAFLIKTNQDRYEGRPARRLPARADRLLPVRLADQPGAERVQGRQAPARRPGQPTPPCCPTRPS